LDHGFLGSFSPFFRVLVPGPGLVFLDLKLLEERQLVVVDRPLADLAQEEGDGAHYHELVEVGLNVGEPHVSVALHRGQPQAVVWTSFRFEVDQVGRSPVAGIVVIRCETGYNNWPSEFGYLSLGTEDCQAE